MSARTTIRPRRWLLAPALMVVLALLAAACGSTPAATTTTVAPPLSTTSQPSETLQELADRISADDAIPAIGLTVFTSEETIDQAVAGVRRYGDDTLVTVDDQFHLGSDTKAMTAALLGRLAERGVLGFDVTLEEAFPTIADMDATFATVTLRQLLSHTAGIDDAAVLGTDIGIDEANDPIPLQRSVSAEWLFSNAPQHAPGDQFMYSNVGFVMAGAAMEAATGESWEDLMVAEVFEPLGMSSCGFGPPGFDSDVDQPWGHNAAGDPMAPGPAADNHPVLGPAGTVHCSMDDWASFLQEMLLALDDQSEFLSQETAKTIFEPVSAGYALGWGVFTRGDVAAFTHDGSNTMWYASAWLVPERDLGWVIVSNASIGPGEFAALVATQEIDSQYVRN